MNDLALDAMLDPVHTRTEARSDWMRSMWTNTQDDLYQTVKVSTPPLERDSLEASLSEDGKMLNLYAKRKIDGCTCNSAIVGALALPHTPQVEDLELTYDPEELTLDVKMPRHSKRQAATPVAVKVLSQQDAKNVEAADFKSPQSSGSSQLRFVPHPSAATNAEESVEAKEKKVLDKFRAVSRVAAASTPQMPSGGAGAVENEARENALEEKVEEVATASASDGATE